MNKPRVFSDRAESIAFYKSTKGAFVWRWYADDRFMVAHVDTLIDYARDKRNLV